MRFDIRTASRAGRGNGIVDGGPHNTIERVGAFDSLFYSEWMERYIRAHPKTEE